MLSSNDGKKIVDRLMNYKNQYTEQEQKLQMKYEDKECTFKPKINEFTNKRGENIKQSKLLTLSEC